MTRELTPEEFRAALDTDLRAPAEERPVAVSVEADVEAGRRLLRRRRVVSGALTAAAATVVVAGLGVTGVLTADDPGEDRPVTVAWSAQEVRDACLAGQSEETGVMTAGGGPKVAAFESNRLWTMAALASADGRYWAECFVSHDGRNEFHSVMTVHRSTGRAAGVGWGSGGGCPKTDSGEVDRGCRQFSLRWVDRVPPVVAAVRFETNDGATHEVRSVDGFVVLNVLGPLPEGVEVDRYGGTGRWQPIHQVTYLDPSGEPLAAQRFDGTGAGPDGNRVDDLPPLAAYPSHRGPDDLG